MEGKVSKKERKSNAEIRAPPTVTIGCARPGQGPYTLVMLTLLVMMAQFGTHGCACLQVETNSFGGPEPQALASRFNEVKWSSRVQFCYRGLAPSTASDCVGRQYLKDRRCIEVQWRSINFITRHISAKRTSASYASSSPANRIMRASSSQCSSLTGKSWYVEASSCYLLFRSRNSSQKSKVGF